MKNIESIKAILQISGAALFIISIIIGFFMGIVPTEVFTGIAGAAIGYIFSDRQNAKEIKALKANNPPIIIDETEI